MGSSERLGYFDFAKGIGMILVVLGHAGAMFFVPDSGTRIFGNYISILGASTMVMFFMISGYQFRHNRRMKECLKTQATVMLIPYALVAIAVIMAKLLLAILKHRSFWEYGGEFLPTYLLALNRGFTGTIWGLPVNNINALWFLLSLFGGWCLYNAITFLDDERVRVGILAFLAVLAMALVWYRTNWYYVVPHILLATTFIGMGNMIKERNLVDKKLPIGIYLVLLIPSFVSFAWGAVDIFDCRWRLYLIDYVGICCFGFILLRLFARLADYDPDNIVYDFISGMGENSLYILCIHSFEDKVLPWRNLIPLFDGKPFFGFVIIGGCRLVVVLVGCFIVKYVMKKFIFKRKKTTRKKIKLDIVD